MKRDLTPVAPIPGPAKCSACGSTVWPHICDRVQPTVAPFPFVVPAVMPGLGGWSVEGWCSCGARVGSHQVHTCPNVATWCGEMYPGTIGVAGTTLKVTS